MADANKSRITIILLLVISILAAIVLTFRQETQEPKKFTLEEKSHFKGDAIGIVEIYGPITADSNSSGLSGIPSGLNRILKNLKNYRENGKVKGVLIRLNSPGGTVGAVQEITREIKRIREKGKPVVITIKDMGASGGYYIAAACDKIVVNPGTLVGSIGVIFMSSDMSGLLDKAGINFQTVKSGPYKDVSSFHRPFEDEERKFLERVIDDTYSQFVKVVSEGRDMNQEKVKELAKGQIYSGTYAKKVNLVDQLGDEVTARETLKKLAEVKDPEFIEPSQTRWFNMLNLLDRRISFINLNINEVTGLSYLYIP
ncbi:MAG: signal peptide peptidase SppA [Elusimicrobiota bacterium]